MSERSFHVGDVLTVTTGHLLSPRGMEGVYDILNFVLSAHLYTHQIPRAIMSSKEFVLRQHPGLRDVDASSVTPEKWKDWLADQVARHGEYLSVAAMTPEERDACYQVSDPVAELVEMRDGRDDIIVVEVGEKS